MSKNKGIPGPDQLEFDCLWNARIQTAGVSHLPSSCSGSHVSISDAPHAVTIVRFVDAATLLVRREAVERVARSGIFALPQIKR